MTIFIRRKLTEKRVSFNCFACGQLTVYQKDDHMEVALDEQDTLYGVVCPTCLAGGKKRIQAGVLNRVNALRIEADALEKAAEKVHRVS